jgi:hypothetical protein
LAVDVSRWSDPRWIAVTPVTRMVVQADVKRLPDAEPTELEHLNLAEILDFRPGQGIIRLHEQRVVILSAAAMGLLRKELIETLGLETARRLMLRFGYADGYHDAVSLRDRSKWATALEGLRAGAVLHRLEGIVRAEILKVEHDTTSGRFEEQVVWHDSYVAEQHVHHYGKSDAPVCWSLVGYASGYASACLGQEIYFRESECLGQARRSAWSLERTQRAGATRWRPFGSIFRARISEERSSASEKPCTGVSRNSIDANGMWPNANAN